MPPVETGDPARFSDAASFVPDRSDNAHLGFGGASHYCVGDPLARAEAQTALAALSEGSSPPDCTPTHPRTATTPRCADRPICSSGSTACAEVGRGARYIGARGCRDRSDHRGGPDHGFPPRRATHCSRASGGGRR